MITEFEIASNRPEFNLLFLLLPLIMILHFYFIYHVKRRGLKFGNFSAMQRVHTKTVISKNLTSLFFFLILITLIIVSLLDITISYTANTTSTDYYILLDSGASMTARDLYPDRYEVAKNLSADLVKNIQNSDIGFISFAGTIIESEALTKEKSVLLNAVDASKIENTGTDIGLAIVSAVQGLLASNDSKTIILISDGHDTVGIPLNSALIKAKEKHVKIISLGIGTKEGGSFLNVPDADNIISKIDEETLRTLSNETGSVYLNIKQDYNINTVMDLLTEEKKSGIIEYKIKDSLLLIILGIVFLIWLIDNTRFRIFP